MIRIRIRGFHDARPRRRRERDVDREKLRLTDAEKGHNYIRRRWSSSRNDARLRGQSERVRETRTKRKVMRWVFNCEENVKEEKGHTKKKEEDYHQRERNKVLCCSQTSSFELSCASSSIVPQVLSTLLLLCIRSIALLSLFLRLHE